MKKILCLLAFVYAGNSHAALITSASDIALASGITETFNSSPIGTVGSAFANANFSILNNGNNVQIYDNSYSSYAGVQSTSNFVYFNYNDQETGFDPDTFEPIFTRNPLKITFTNPTKAFGFNYAQNCSGFQLALYNLLDELIEEHYVSFNPDISSYVGASSTQNIGYIVIKEDGPGNSSSFDEGYLDNFTTVSSVPLPATLPLLLSGLGMLGFAQRKLRM
jgi:hypothetical protein